MRRTNFRWNSGAMTPTRVDEQMVRDLCAADLGIRDPLIRHLVGDGFSGSCLWRVTPSAAAGDLVVKSFPCTSQPQVEWVHGLMRHLRAAGCLEIPEVVVATGGGTIVTTTDGRAWEAVRFVDGEVTDAPGPGRAMAAMAALARLHVAAASWPAAPPASGAAPAVARRIAHAGRLLAEPWSDLAAMPPPADPLAAMIAERLRQAIAIAGAADLPAALRRVATASFAPVPLQAVLRDVWSGHVIFAAGEQRVAGIIDLHAAAVDTPATDVARLLGSWRRDAAVPPDVARGDAVAAYEAVRPLTATERRLVPWLQATGTVFGLDNWFRWVLAEGRQFERPLRVTGRVDRLLATLPLAITWLHRGQAAV